jgi:hypothetical protein
MFTSLSGRVQPASRDRRKRFCAFLALAFLAPAASAQDERSVTSPNGQIEFRLFVATQGNSNLPRIAYEVSYRNKPLLGMSFLGLDIFNQEPMLGENDGLMSSSATKGSLYNSLTAKYMQNGSLGRLIDVEARAYDDGVAFRYVIPPSTPLTEILIAEEATEFHFAQEITADPVLHLAAGWVTITESKPGSYPPMRLTRSDQTTELTRLTRSSDRKIAFEGTTPLTCPWRIIAIGPDRGRVLKSTIIADLKP